MRRMWNGWECPSGMNECASSFVVYKNTRRMIVNAQSTIEYDQEQYQ
jgi:hypothetical protein